MAKYFKAKDRILAACVAVKAKKFVRAGALLQKASQEEDFDEALDEMDQQQDAGMQQQQQQQQGDDDDESALAAIISGMQDNDNSIDDLLDALDIDSPDIESEDVNVDDAASDSDVVNIDDDGELKNEEVASARRRRALANLKRLK